MQQVTSSKHARNLLSSGEQRFAHHKLQRAELCLYLHRSELANQAAQEEVCKMCVSVHIFQKAFGPMTFRQMIWVQPNRNNSLPPSRPFPMQNDRSQVPTLSSKNDPTCAWVRPSSPYYRVRILHDITRYNACRVSTCLLQGQLSAVRFFM